MTKMSVELLSSEGNDLSVVNAARVSFDKFHEVYEPSKDDKLINYLAREGHWSPFCHNFLSFRIKAPIFIARQLVKHHVGGNWNEASRRYVDSKPELWWPENDGMYWRKRAESVKQGSSTDYIDLSKVCVDELCTLEEEVHGFHRYVLNLYNMLLAANVCPEQARMVLPQNMMTEWIWSGNLYFFSRVVKQRLEKHAQRENHLIAEPIKQVLAQHFPISTKALLGE